LIRPFLKQKKIVLRKEQKKETVNIMLSVSTLGSETNYLGGMEGFIVDASIKEVLAEISLQCKSNLFIIDEGISALDKKNMENLDQFFHFLEERHPHVFIISHLSEAQHIVRHSLQISKVEEYSKIDYV
jgi:DNA repair exonuclease SbcCD ATPase subunit